MASISRSVSQASLVRRIAAWLLSIALKPQNTAIKPQNTAMRCKAAHYWWRCLILPVWAGLSVRVSVSLTTWHLTAKTLTNALAVRPRGTDASSPIRDENFKWRVGNHASGIVLSLHVFNAVGICLATFFWRNSITSRFEPGAKRNALDWFRGEKAKPMQDIMRTKK